MKTFGWLMIALLSSGCAGTIPVPLPSLPTHQAPHPVPLPKAGVNVFDTVTCRTPAHGDHCDDPIAGVTVKVHTGTNPDTYDTQVSDANGYNVWSEQSTLPNSDITFEKAGYLPQTVGVLVSDLVGQHNIFQLYSVHVDPASFTDAQIRTVKTSLNGVFINEIAPACPVDPVTGIACVGDNGATAHGLVAGALFTPAYRMYTTAQRQIIRDVFTGKLADRFGIVHHYTHFTISLACIPGGGREYHGIYPPCSTAKIGLNDALHELWDDGLIPVTFAMDDSEPDDLTTPLSIAGIVDPSLVRIVSPYWEHLQIDCAAAKVRALFPHAFLYWHDPIDPHADSGYPDACYGHSSEAEWGALGGARGWWQHFHDAYGGTGYLVQTDRGSVADVLDALTDIGSRMGGGLNGWPILDVVWFEDTDSVYDVFWGGGDERLNLQRADQVLAAQPFCLSGKCGMLAGYGSGGSK